jgi:hypothetical protein
MSMRRYVLYGRWELLPFDPPSVRDAARRPQRRDALRTSAPRARVPRETRY